MRAPSEDYSNCHSTQPDRGSISLDLAKRQHAEYVAILKEAGLDVTQLPPLKGYPDSVFIQDPALLGETVSMIGRFGLKSRVGEESALVDDITSQRLEIGTPRRIDQSGHLEGGDILVTESGIFAGATSRTDQEGLVQLTSLLCPFPVTPITTRAFHLLCGCSYLGNNTIAVAPSIVDPRSFRGYKLVTVPEDEEYAANMVYLGDRRVLVAAGHPQTIARLKHAKYEPVELDNSEFRKGDGGLSCLSSPVYKVF